MEVRYTAAMDPAPQPLHRPVEAPPISAPPLTGADLPALPALHAMWARIRPHLRPTCLIRSIALDRIAGVEVLLISETFQHTGSFKYRAALSAALHSPAPRLLCASSGNFGAALARAAAQAGKGCAVIMPHRSAQVKIDAVRGHGAEVDLIDTAVTSRAARLAQRAAADPEAEAVSPYDDARVIAGNASLGAEIFAQDPPPCLIAPVGGGGLSAGLVVARDHLAPGCEVFGAEPLLCNDAARSLREGRLVADEREGDTLCDGARTLSLGRRNFAILRRGLAGVCEVTEAQVRRAVRLLFSLANLKAEPTGALALAALLSDPARFSGRKRVACVVSGGNVDPAAYARLIVESEEGA